jgi:hypothetical protein
MIKNVIILGLLAMIVAGMSFGEAATYIEESQVIDKISELLYNVIRSVKENV